MRNFLIRTASAIVFLAVILAALLWHPLSFGIIFSLLVAVMMGEYLHLTMGNHHKFAQSASILVGTLLFILTFLYLGYGMDGKWFFLIPILLAFLIILQIYDKEKGVSSPLLSSILYIALPLSLCNLPVFREGRFDGTLLLSLLILLWASDVGAYIFGMLFGQKHGHKLFPSISPKKSWEGYIGGLILAIIAGWLLTRVGMLPCGIGHSLILAIIVNVFGTLGDLAESLIKRNFGVKDSGRIMPGHGGMLDRFDGALLAFPVAISYIMIIGI